MRGRTMLGLAAGAAVLALTGYGTLVEPRTLRTAPVDLACDGLAGRPVRVLVFSDVAFPGAASARDSLLEAARRFDPDLVLIAGDLIDSPRSAASPEILAGARAWLDRLPAPGLRFLAPGEEESPNLGELRRAWPPETVHVLAGERRLVDAGGARIDLFGADRLSQSAPWVHDVAGERPAVVSFGGNTWSRLATRERVVPPGPFEIALAFQVDGPRSYLSIAVEAGDGAPGWRLVRYERRPEFRLATPEGVRLAIGGRTGSGFSPPAGVWCRARIRSEPVGADAALRARFWVEGEPEPGAWDVDAVLPGGAARKARSLAFVGRAGSRRIADLVLKAGEREIFTEPFSDAGALSRRWEQPSRLAAWIAEPPAGIRIVLAHDPDVVREVAGLPGAPPCVVVAGHTHGGQLRLPLLGPPFVGTHIGRRFARGLLEWHDVPLLVTSGVGTSVLPVRFGVPPEVVTLTLSPAGAEPAPATGTLAPSSEDP